MARASTARARRSSGAVKPVEDEVRAGQLPWVGGLVAPLHDSVRIHDHERALREPTLVVDAEGAASPALGLPVRQLLDAHAQLVLERPLGPRGVAGDAVQPGAARLELFEDFLVDVELVAA